ncbi:hypothetical protein SODALDRAFT_353380 [Sodiomyces alkalinus F11]|uniref:C2H2-type domain-containing protein n=1 Tax=Sodiomyces alkalinus (strain CBS 110278 / VKM F-3762 / F11) TaxID=1314773 RepID=A0A3N2PKK2_SODAK|nr:hypothetical protein SODALDRAFT_353380 [Sodiomyces alkalinus F11]ROT34934.1 hypothetical protein SODALDRAFT_353380 [Sodiomyces alkalinus F11]
MPTEPWSLTAQQFGPRVFGRTSHQRESSLSSLGSTGPASPYNPTIANPQIAIDPAGDGFGDMQIHEEANQYYDLAKSLSAQDGLYTGYHSMNNLEHPEMGYPSTIPIQRARTERGGLLPTPEFTTGQNRSHPGSVASSSVGGDSPATPTQGESEEDNNCNRRRTMSKTALWPTMVLCSTLNDLDADTFHDPPKLDRTMTDIYSDELYNPNFTITSSSSPQQSQVAMSPSSDVFSQRLHAANNQHLSTAHSPASSVVSRERSPLRQDSPMVQNVNANSSNFANSLPPTRFAFNSAHQMREREKAEQDALMMRHHLSQQQKSEHETPETISPKDAMLEFPGSEDSNYAPLFPQPDASFGGAMDQMSKMTPANDQLSMFQRHGGHQVNDVSFSFMHPTSQLSANMHIPQHYPFIAEPRQQQHQQQQQQHVQMQQQRQQRQQQQNSPARLSSVESSSPSALGTPVSLQKPAGASADGGTYTCTYHGCTLRFETPALLQKHKREGHRHSQGTGPRRAEHTSSTPAEEAVVDTQAGPHRCDRINPGTGKPCNTIFSRPYDLTRHEDTIHNARKQKVRCNLCTEEKTFSRADALTRHYRVCHPDVELPSKYRRRGNHN